jgi:hypothetical protein
LNGDTKSAAELSSWSGPRTITFAAPEPEPPPEPTLAADVDSTEHTDLGATSWTNPEGGRIAAARLVWPEREDTSAPIGLPRESRESAADPPSGVRPAAPNGVWARPREPESDVSLHEPDSRTDFSPAAVGALPGREAPPHGGGTCDHCASRDLQLQRMARNDAVLESWWLCGACGTLSHRIQPADPATGEDERESAPAPAPLDTGTKPTVDGGAYSDFGSALKRVLAEEAIVASETARLRAELTRAEQDLHDLQMLPQLLDRIIRERRIS